MRYLASVSEAARLAKVPERTIHRWAVDGLVTSVRRGPRGTLVDLDQVCDLAAKRDENLDKD